MLNDFHMMVLAVLACQGGIAVLLAVMAMLEPEKPGAGARIQTASRPGPISHRTVRLGAADGHHQ